MPQDSSNTPPAYSGNFQQLAESENQEDFTAAVQISTGRILKDLHVEEERTEEIIEKIEKDSLYKDVRNSWENLDPEERGLKWQQQLERIVQLVYESRPYCMRCGECCSRVSPSLHYEDLGLFDDGTLRHSDLYTLRKGEPVRNNVRNTIDNLPHDLIKVKELPDTRECIFYEAAGKSCKIYDRRPLQCRAQECWNPDSLEKLWSRDKLSRRHFIQDDEELLELIDVHNQRCSPEAIDKAVKAYWDTGEPTALDPVVQMLSQDVIIRNFFLEKLGRDEAELDFLLGRPLARIVEAYGLKVEQDAGGTYHLIQSD